MVATIDCAEKSKPATGNKVSKPIMEKKRRARINKCLDQLKTLLESYYSSSIRKRKLEKADILELTVKHLKHLQKTQSFGGPAAELSDFQSGFHSCLASFNHYLLMADNLNERERRMLSQLPGNIRGSHGREDGSVRGGGGGGGGAAAAAAAAAADKQEATGNEEGAAAALTRRAPLAHGAIIPRCPRSEGARPSTLSSSPRDEAAVESPKSTVKKFNALRDCREEATQTQRVWRPW